MPCLVQAGLYMEQNEHGKNNNNKTDIILLSTIKTDIFYAHLLFLLYFVLSSFNSFHIKVYIMSKINFRIEKQQHQLKRLLYNFYCELLWLSK